MKTTKQIQDDLDQIKTTRKGLADELQQLDIKINACLDELSRAAVANEPFSNNELPVLENRKRVLLRSIPMLDDKIRQLNFEIEENQRLISAKQLREYEQKILSLLKEIQKQIGITGIKHQLDELETIATAILNLQGNFDKDRAYRTIAYVNQTSKDLFYAWSQMQVLNEQFGLPKFNPNDPIQREREFGKLPKI